MILASCSCEESKKYKNKLVVVSEDNKKPEEVILNIVTDTPDEVLFKGIGKAKCVTTRVRPSICPKELWGNVFHEVPLSEFNGIDEVDGVICLVRLPDGFSDMREAYNLCLSNGDYEDVTSKVRLIGGNLLEIPGVSIGRYDDGKEKMASVFNGVYDFFTEAQLSDIDVREVMSKVRSVGNKSSEKSTIKKPSVKSKKKETFAKFFGDCNGGF